jgi:ligand-binding sensor domain-containing protein
VLVGTTGGLFESSDLGRTFQRTLPEVVVNSIMFDPKNPQVVLIATEADGILRSTDGGVTFRDSSSGLSEARVSAVARTAAGRVILARAADGKSGGLWDLNVDTGIATRMAHQVSATVMSLAARGERIFAGTPDGLFVAATDGKAFERVLPTPIRGLAVTSTGLVAAATMAGVYSSKDGSARWERMGTQTKRVDSIQEAYLPETGQLSLAIEAGGYFLIWTGQDWVMKGNLVRGDQKLAGGFGRQKVTIEPRFVPVGLSLDPGNGFLVFRPRSNPPGAVFLAPPEGGLAISGWSGDPATRDGLLVGTIGRGLFRYVPPQPERVEAAP